MSAIAMGGGSGAVAASAHAGCERYRGTDPLITGQPRRSFANALGFPDTSGQIPQSRWSRAMAFESIIRTEKFATRIATTTAGQLGLPRPKAVVVVDGAEDVDTTVRLLDAARKRAESDSAATLVHKPAVSFPGFSTRSATRVLPDFVVVIPKPSGQLGAWVVVGDAKDYERVRSKIDDDRMLKGFLQVAFGAEALERWTRLPSGLDVHRFGVLAVPRNAYLHPVVVSEDLADHRREVAMRLQQRIDEASRITWTGDHAGFVAHLEAQYDPATCTSCSLFNFCRSQLRSSADPANLLVEVGVPAERRASLLPLVDGSGELSPLAPASWVARLTATITGVAEHTGRRRTDPVVMPGTINVVLVKSDFAALGVHGVSIQLVSTSGASDWQTTVFAAAQTNAARRSLLGLLGAAIREALATVDSDARDGVSPAIHIVVPDKASADLLASIADSVGGSEVSRLRFMRDVEMGREPLTPDGEPATIPEPLLPDERLAVSFLLEDDRARAFANRTTTVDLSATLANHVVAGGPAVDSSRLDYVVAWAESTPANPVDFRALADTLEASPQTPGAKLSRVASDTINEALVGRGGRASNPHRYESAVRDELAYKADVFDRAVTALRSVPSSNLRAAVLLVEADAQAVWRRRNELQAFDLIRFGRTNRNWRNELVPVVQANRTVAAQLGALTDPVWADESARAAGTREMAIATVESSDPLLLRVHSRTLKAGSRAVVLHVNGRAVAERESVTTKVAKGAVEVHGIPKGNLLAGPDPHDRQLLEWDVAGNPGVAVGDELVVADVTWFNGATNPSYVKVERPRNDTNMSPKGACGPESFAESPKEHMWCCQPHVSYEAVVSDRFAEERARNELNPVVWPPVKDEDGFDVAAEGDPEPAVDTSVELPDGLTVDDLE